MGSGLPEQIGEKVGVAFTCSVQAPWKWAACLQTREHTPLASTGRPWSRTRTTVTPPRARHLPCLFAGCGSGHASGVTTHQGYQHRVPPVLLPGWPRLAAQTRLLRPLLEATVPGGDHSTSCGCRVPGAQMGFKGAGTLRSGPESSPGRVLRVALGRVPQP